MNRILFESGEVAADGLVSLRDGRARHIREVLRAEPGARLRVGVLDGPCGSALVEQSDGETVTLRCAWEPETEENGGALELILALPRPKVLKRLWAPLASFGLSRLTLVNAAKVARRVLPGVAQAGAVRRRRLFGSPQSSRCISRT